MVNDPPGFNVIVQTTGIQVEIKKALQFWIEKGGTDPPFAI